MACGGSISVQKHAKSLRFGSKIISAGPKMFCTCFNKSQRWVAGKGVDQQRAWINKSQVGGVTWLGSTNHRGGVALVFRSGLAFLVWAKRR